MSISYEAHLVDLMERFGREAIEREYGYVDQEGTRWASVPVAGPENLFTLARKKAALDLPLGEE